MESRRSANIWAVHFNSTFYAISDIIAIETVQWTLLDKKLLWYLLLSTLSYV